LALYIPDDLHLWAFVLGHTDIRLYIERAVLVSEYPHGALGLKAVSVARKNRIALVPEIAAGEGPQILGGGRQDGDG
jgi:hypothetical protein